jgi:hypothetical protein
MKTSKKNLRGAAFLIILGLVLGTLGWELLERVLSYGGIDLHLAVGPVGFDIGVLAVKLLINPGSFLGAAAGFLVFRRL